MSKAPSPLLGFNNNIKHKGRVFHVQTEDSGIRHPHIITHLFMDGGRILKTVKTSYAEHLADEKMGEIVRKMMKDQHKAMFMALRDGAFDAQINYITPGLGDAAPPPSLASGATEAPSYVLGSHAPHEPPPVPRPSLPSLDLQRPASMPAEGETVAARAPAPPAESAARALPQEAAARVPAPPEPTPSRSQTSPQGPAAIRAAQDSAPASMRAPTPQEAPAPPRPAPQHEPMPASTRAPVPPQEPALARSPILPRDPAPASTRAPALPQEQVAARGAAPQDPNARGPASTRSPTSPGFARVPGVILAPGVEVRPVELPVEGSWGEDPAPRYTRTQSPGGTPIPRTPTEPPARPGSQPPAGAPARPRTPLSSFPTSDLPPPPASVLGKNRPQGGAYSEVSALAKPSTGQEKTPSGRYLASRPSSPAATSRPPDGRSLFGDDLISEKSLDEVILSYLAEDLDTTPPKK